MTTEHVLTIRLTATRSQIRWGLAAVFLLAGAADLDCENVTLTTYYPAPSGVYTQMITTGNTYLSRDGGQVILGPATAAVPARDSRAIRLMTPGNIVADDIYLANPRHGIPRWASSRCTTGTISTRGINGYAYYPNQQTIDRVCVEMGYDPGGTAADTRNWRSCGGHSPIQWNGTAYVTAGGCTFFNTASCTRTVCN